MLDSCKMLQKQTEVSWCPHCIAPLKAWRLVSPLLCYLPTATSLYIFRTSMHLSSGITTVFCLSKDTGASCFINPWTYTACQSSVMKSFVIDRQVLFCLLILPSSNLLCWFLSVSVFGRCILRPSSGVPCLSGHRNNSNRKIIFIVWLLIKLGVQKWFPRLNHFYAQINRGHLRKAGGYSGRRDVKKNKKKKTSNKDEDHSPKTLID